MEIVLGLGAIVAVVAAILKLYLDARRARKDHRSERDDESPIVRPTPKEIAQFSRQPTDREISDYFKKLMLAFLVTTGFRKKDAEAAKPFVTPTDDRTPDPTNNPPKGDLGQPTFETSAKKRAYVVWLDDDFQHNIVRIDPWLHAVTQILNEDVGLICCRSITQFAQALRESAMANIADGQRISALIIDLMLVDEADTFSDLGFPTHCVSPHDAGAQIAGLLRNPSFDAPRPKWLDQYRNTPVCILSFSPLLEENVSKYVPPDRRENLRLAEKSLVLNSDSGTRIHPSSQCIKALVDTIGSASTGARSIPP